MSSFWHDCDLASAIAVEHVLWARQAGQWPLDIFDLVGIPWQAYRQPCWDDAILVLCRAWRGLAPKLAA